MTPPKITLDTNCVINLLDYSAKTPTSVDVLSQILRYGLSSRADIAVTTRVEADLEGDKNETRKLEMRRKLSALPIVGTVGRWDVSRWDSGDVWGSEETTRVSAELQAIIFPGLCRDDRRYINKINDIDHLVGHILNKRDLFVTDDRQILNRSEQLRLSPGIVVVTPQACLEYLEAAEARRKKPVLSIDQVTPGCLSPGLAGRVSFDYSNNNGIYVIGNGQFMFETKWSKASNERIHAYSDPPSIKGIALAKGIAELKQIQDAATYDYSSRARTVGKGQFLLLENVYGMFAAIQVTDIKDDTRGDDKDELTFEYVIQESGSVNFDRGS